jgi:hypothetical protein
VPPAASSAVYGDTVRSATERNRPPPRFVLDIKIPIQGMARNDCRGSRRPGHRSRFAVVLYRATRWVTEPPVAVRPPSTTNCPPVVLEARSEHRKSTMLAISSTVA